MRAPAAEVKSCPRCRVTAPPEYRRCVHCGARLVGGSAAGVLLRATGGASEDHPGEVTGGGVLETAAGEAAPEEEARGGVLGRIPWFWLLLLLVPLLRRACAPE